MSTLTDNELAWLHAVRQPFRDNQVDAVLKMIEQMIEHADADTATGADDKR